MERKIKTLEGVAANEVAEVFNDAFADYFIPFRLSEEQLIQKMRVDKTDLSLSVGVFDNGQLIAFILHGKDTINQQKVAYNGGTGVIPEKRGAGLAKQMYRFILPILAAKGINSLVLEVISNNVQAIKSYKQSGFETRRKLLCYKGKIAASTKNNEVKIKELRNYDWELMESFWDILPTWQNARSAIEEVKTTNVSLGASIENQLVGYVIYSPSNRRIQQIAVHRDFRQKGIASTLVSVLVEAHGSTIFIINVDENSTPVNAFLKKIGLEMSLEQMEMELKIEKTDIFTVH
ncbi:MAG: GNAT family N-acetyltransferase [Bacteroidota bacterium]